MFVLFLIFHIYHEADKKVALRAKAKNEMMKEQLRGCSFRPNIGKPSSGGEYVIEQTRKEREGGGEGE